MPSVSKVLGDLASSTGSISVAAGSSTAPAITTSGDTNTGMFFPAADTIAFAEGGTEAMRLDANGNIGIGTASPATKLAVSGEAKLISATQSILSFGNSVSATFAKLEYDDTTGNFNLNNPRAFPLRFLTDNTERMRISSDGTVLIGTTTAPANNGYFNVNGGDIACTGGYRTKVGNSSSLGGNKFNINWTGAAQLWIDSTNLGTILFSSDYRIKRNIETQTAPALERVMALRPVTYQMADYGTLFKEDGVAREGFIAHELAEVIPSAVEGEKDAEDQIQSLKLDALCSVMVKAIQEQQTIINDLKARIETLEAN
jgi:hypothetical protein